MDLLGNLSQEWSTLASAPITFFFAMIVAFGAAYFVAKLRYASLLKSKEEEIERLSKNQD